MKKILKAVFGFDTFRPYQAEIIENILQGRDTLVVMPTGGGKSLCYQLPALMFSGLTVVVSPLISLMQDQVDQLKENGVFAVTLNSTLLPDVFRKNVDSLRRGTAKLLYIAPESLLKPRIREMLSKIRVDCLAIDEAHCISFWGHDFRPEYRQLAGLRPEFSDAACVALTATATPRVREDIKKSLRFSDTAEFVASFNRENLFLRVWEKENPLEQTLNFVRRFPGESGIIYCFTRKQVDSLYESLQSGGFSVLPYHAGLNEARRRRNQERFIRDDVKIIVATIAFGMGINKPNIRFVVHYDLPQTLENYYQEIGRAGRDGLWADCLLLLGYGDIRKIKHFIAKKNPGEQKAARMQLGVLLRYAESRNCRRIPLLSYFGEKSEEETCGMCDNCKAQKKPLSDITIPAQKFLSCVRRTGELFGPNHIIDVLRGSRPKKVVKNRHDRLSTYGIGTDFSKKQWLQLNRQFIYQELLDQDLKYGSLRVTQKGWEVLRGKIKVFGFLKPEEDTPVVTDTITEVREHDRRLFEKLRALRKMLAGQAGMPPYIIFPDKTLVEMSTFFPQNPESLQKIHGVGRAKLEKYGEVFLNEIKAYCRKHGLGEIKAGAGAQRPAASGLDSPAGARKRFQIIGENFSSGKSVEQIMEEFGIKESTVLGYLYDYLRAEYPLEPERLYNLCKLPGEEKRRVTLAFDRLGNEFLRPVFDMLEGKVTFEDLQRLRLYHFSKNISLKVTGSSPAAASRKPMVKEIVCLAGSRKYSGFCFAGREIAGGIPGKWVRPVSLGETGELTFQQMQMEHGAFPKLLDIVKIPLARKTPVDYHSENFQVRAGTFEKAGQFPAGEIEKLCDHPEFLWINGYASTSGINDRMPLEMVKETVSNSLYLIHVRHPKIIVEEGRKLLKQIRMAFVYNNVMYRLMVTDPVVENIYLSHALGEYPMEGAHVYITVSISEPFHGFCYKLAAAVIDLSGYGVEF